MQKTKVSFVLALKLTFLLIFNPTEFNKLEDEDSKLLNKQQNNIIFENKSQIIRKALLNSFLLILASAIVGFIAACITKNFTVCITPRTTSNIQIIGSMLLLWGTLFVRGYEISTWKGNTYSEQINQWIYRGMYCLGTGIMVYSLLNIQCST